MNSAAREMVKGAEFRALLDTEAWAVFTSEGDAIVLKILTEDIDGVERIDDLVVPPKTAESLARDLLRGLARLNRGARFTSRGSNGARLTNGNGNGHAHDEPDDDDHDR